MSKLIKAITFFALFFIALSIVGWVLSKTILNYLIRFIPKQIEIVALNPMEVFTTALGISVVFALIITIPIIIIFALNYFKPALYSYEKMFINKILIAGTLLFLLGVSVSLIGFVYFGLEWFANFNINYGFATLWSLQQTINTILILSIVAGIMFEFPLLVYYLIKKNIIQFKLTMASRVTGIVALLLIIGFITPDGSLFTQVFLSLPIYGLFEASVYLGNKRQEVRT